MRVVVISTEIRLPDDRPGQGKILAVAANMEIAKSHVMMIVTMKSGLFKAESFEWGRKGKLSNNNLQHVLTVKFSNTASQQSYYCKEYEVIGS